MNERSPFPPIDSGGFDAQINQAYCAVATSAAVLNSLKLSKRFRSTDDLANLTFDLPVDPRYVIKLVDFPSAHLFTPLLLVMILIRTQHNVTSWMESASGTMSSKLEVAPVGATDQILMACSNHPTG